MKLNWIDATVTAAAPSETSASVRMPIGLLVQVAVDADRDSRGGRGTEPHQRVLPFDVHAENLRALKTCGARRFQRQFGAMRALFRLSGRWLVRRFCACQNKQTT